MSIKQFNGTYFPNDDRVIFRFNTVDHSEYKFWLTRRITHYILISTSQLFEKPNEEKHVISVEKAISEFQEQTLKVTTHFSQDYQPGVQYPIGADPILVIDARCEVLKIENQDIVALDFILPGGGTVNLKVTVSSMQNLVVLLGQLNTQAQWGKPLNISFQPRGDKN
jgi:hypothetical protein